MPARLVKSRERVRDVGEVFTPDFLVEQMLDLFPTDAWLPDKVWLEPTCGNGQFILGILRRKIKTGSALLQALNTTFGADIMSDNVSECHARIYKEIVVPYFKSHKVRGVQLKKDQLEAVCLVEHNIRLTKNSLEENFSTWQHFVDTSSAYQAKQRIKTQKILHSTDHKILPSSGIGKRMYKELLALQEI